MLWILKNLINHVHQSGICNCMQARSLFLSSQQVILNFSFCTKLPFVMYVRFSNYHFAMIHGWSYWTNTSITDLDTKSFTQISNYVASGILERTIVLPNTSCSTCTASYIRIFLKMQKIEQTILRHMPQYIALASIQ